MFKKLLLLISTLLVSLKLSFAASNLADFNLLSSFDIFGNLYNILKGNNHILDGIAVIIFFVSSFQIFNNILSKIFKGSGHAQARKGASAILSIFITGALVIHTPSGGFVSFWGGLLLFYIGVAMLFGLYFPWVKKTWENNVENRAKALFLISLASLMLIFSIESFATRLFDNNAQNAFTWQLVNYLASLNGILILICIFSLIKIVSNWNKMNTSSSDSVTKKKKNRDNSFLKIINVIKENYGEGSKIIGNLNELYNK